MDKKNTTIGVLLIGAAIALLFWTATNQPPAPPQKNVPAQTQAGASVPVVNLPAAISSTASASANTAETVPAQTTERVPEEIFSLESDFLKLNISSHDATLKSVVFKKQPVSLTDASPIVFNADSNVPALTLAGAPEVAGTPPVPLGIAFSIESQTEDVAAKTRTITLRGAGRDGLEFRRSYTLNLNADGQGVRDPYFLGHKIEIKRISGTPAPLPIFISTGTFPPTAGDRANVFLNASYFNGDDYEKVEAKAFTYSAGFLGFGGNEAARDVPVFADRENPFRWVAVTNQYFAGILSFPKQVQPIVSKILVFPEPIKNPEPDATLKNTAVAYAGLDVPALQVGQVANLELPYYIGPKEYVRMAALSDSVEEVDRVVQFTRLFLIFSIDWLCKILVYVMNVIHGWLPTSAWAWGWSILVMTLIVKLITWPLTMAQQRSAKKMQKFQEPMKAIREKYKDNPQKQQQEMMKLYREHKINPLAGCFPILIQIPIFFGMYCAFQTCAELRLQGFLWIPDLSMPDVIPGLETLWGFPVHILPILMGATMLLNMRMTPMPNSNPGQKQMFYAMMAIFPIICYSMPSALTLYWTVQNIFTIFQTWLVRRARDKDDVPGKVDIIPPPAQKKKGRGKNVPAR